jgi:hypothetical protein
MQMKFFLPVLELVLYEENKSDAIDCDIPEDKIYFLLSRWDIEQMASFAPEIRKDCADSIDIGAELHAKSFDDYSVIVLGFFSLINTAFELDGGISFT